VQTTIKQRWWHRFAPRYRLPPGVAAASPCQCELALAHRERGGSAVGTGATEIASRRQFDHALPRTWGRAIVTGEAVALLLIEVDYFQRFIELYGHAAGNACLHTVAALLQQAARNRGDLVARYSDARFAILLPGRPAEGALDSAIDVHRALARAAIVHADSTVSLHVTVSIGIATMVPQPGSDPAMLVQRARQSLGFSKVQGRNRSA
jgi:diguanylate cyclase (GGDEF)-like protein